MYYDSNQENICDNFYADTREWDAHRAEIESVKVSQPPSIFRIEFMSPAPARKTAKNAINIQSASTQGSSVQDSPMVRPFRI